MFHPKNSILIKNYFEDPHDDELIKLIPFLKFLSKCDDVKSVKEYQIKFNSKEKFIYTDTQNNISWHFPEEIHQSESQPQEVNIQQEQSPSSDRNRIQSKAQDLEPKDELFENIQQRMIPCFYTKINSLHKSFGSKHIQRQSTSIQQVKAIKSEGKINHFNKNLLKNESNYLSEQSRLVLKKKMNSACGFRVSKDQQEKQIITPLEKSPGKKLMFNKISIN